MDPLSDIENEKGNHDTGVMAFQVWSGARSAGASRMDASFVTYAWFRAMIDAGRTEET